MRASYDGTIHVYCPRCGEGWELTAVGDSELGDLLVGFAQRVYEIEQEHPKTCRPPPELKLVPAEEDL